MRRPVRISNTTISKREMKSCTDKNRLWPDSVDDVSPHESAQFFDHVELCPYHEEILFAEEWEDEERLRSMFRLAHGLDSNGVLLRGVELQAARKEHERRLQIWKEAEVRTDFPFSCISLFNGAKEIACCGKFFDFTKHESINELDPQAGLQIRGISKNNADEDVLLGFYTLAGARHEDKEQLLKLDNGYTVGLRIQKFSERNFRVHFRCGESKAIEEEQAEAGGDVPRRSRQGTRSRHGESRSINLISASTANPQHRIKTTELVASLIHKLSPELINTICSLGVDQRYSVMDNYVEFLEGKPMSASTSTTGLGVDATRRCIEEWGGDPARVGLLVAATNTHDQMLPCLASEVMGRTHGLLSRSLRTVSMQSQGSVLLKSVEVAQWYLEANPNKLAIVLLAEAHTPYVTPLLSDEYRGYRELLRLRKEGRINEAEFEQQRLDTTFVIQSMLFGDGAVALLMGNEAGKGKPAFGPISHLTNDNPGDRDLLTMTNNRSHNFLKGRPQYFMRPSVPVRGAHYAVTTVKNVLNDPDSPVSNLNQVEDCMIHTGSKKILDGVCSHLALNKDSDKVLGSYQVLKNYGNLSSASTGFMLAEKEAWNGPAIIAGIGVGFAASAGVMSLN